MLNQKNTKKQGDVGLGSAIAYFTSIGWSVSLPLTDNQEYDLVVDDNSLLKKVQVKTSKFLQHSGAYKVELRTLGGNQSWSGVVKYFDPQAVDILYILCDDGSRYCIPSYEITGTRCITVGNKYQEFKI